MQAEQIELAKRLSLSEEFGDGLQTLEQRIEQ
jgi:hypothetical protein